jgi:hypothetical protein
MPLARFDTWVRSAVGPAAAGTQVYICTQPAVTTTIPPSPLAALFADSGQVTPVAQPLVADGFGHAYGYVASGTYTVVLVQYGLVQQVFPDQLIGAGAGSSLVLQTNGVPNTVQSLLNLNGAGSVSVSSDGVGGVTITGLGIGGSDTQIQYNAAGVVAGDPDFEWDYTNKVLKLGDTTNPGTIKFTGITSGIITLKAPTAPATWALTLPTSAGSSGQVLTTDGTGITTWGSASSGGGVLGLWSGNWCGFNMQASPSGSTFPGAQNTNPGQINSGYPVVIVNPTATTPRGAKIQSSSLTAASGVGDQVNFLTPGTVRDWFIKGAIDGLVHSRYWVGMTDTAFASIPTTMNSDTPAANVIAFRWDSDTDSSNFKAVCQTDATHQTVVDTGVAVVVDAIHLFEIVPQSGGTVMKFYIDGSLVATISTNVPAAGTGMTWCFTVDGLNQGSTDFNFIFYYFNCLVVA